MVVVVVAAVMLLEVMVVLAAEVLVVLALMQLPEVEIEAEAVAALVPHLLMLLLVAQVLFY